jgi:GNAT superfamily N-acetyltransferase
MPPSDIEYRFMRPGEETAACALVKSVFDQHVASDLGPEGIAEFFRFANPQAMAARSDPEQVLLVALHDGQIVGVLEVRSRSHLALLFVSLKRRGIARGLLRMAISECRARQPRLSALTVNSSLYAQPIYERLGFIATAPARTINGIVHVPMALTLAEA